AGRPAAWAFSAAQSTFSAVSMVLRLSDARSTFQLAVIQAASGFVTGEHRAVERGALGWSACLTPRSASLRSPRTPRRSRSRAARGPVHAAQRPRGPGGGRSGGGGAGPPRGSRPGHPAGEIRDGAGDRAVPGLARARPGGRGLGPGPLPPLVQRSSRSAGGPKAGPAAPAVLPLGRRPRRVPNPRCRGTG